LSQIKKGKPRPDLKGRVSPNKGKTKQKWIRQILKK
jgi:hypothetical protein